MLFDERLELRFGRMTPADRFASVPAFGLQVSGGINGNPTSIFVNAPSLLRTRNIVGDHGID
jgi:carbohydrate-selective porin OprB